MTHSEARKTLRRIARRREKIEKDLDQLKHDETQAILDALRLGVRPVEIAAELKRSTEYVRQVARRGGIAPMDRWGDFPS